MRANVIFVIAVFAVFALSALSGAWGALTDHEREERTLTRR
jgi:hypothetical protein